MEHEELLEVDEQDYSQHEDEPAAGDPKPADPKDDLKDIRSELKSLRTRLSETEADARYWREQSRNGGRNSEEEEAEPEEEEDIQVSDDLLEAFSSGDPKRVAKVMREMGFTRQSDVRRAIGATRKEITEQGQLYQTYPDLADTNSDFFKSTAKTYNELVKKDPSLKSSPATIEIAARITASELGIEEESPRRGSRRNDDDEDAEFERQRRVAAQSGDRGRPRRAAASRDDESELSGVQRSIIAKFQAAGSSVTEEGYRKRASNGIRMSGLPTRRGKR